MVNIKIIKKVVFSITLIVLSVPFFAHGKKDVDEKNVDNLVSWQETFDINKKKKGKYNIFITATDLGGNSTVIGPYNLFIDPKSDMPVSGITNPQQDMRVVGNLNIVGTCIDDDAVEHVELILDGDKDNPIKAVGKEFWSYYLDTRDLPEGLHTIKVTGYDINGLAGESYEMSWNLDRRQPVTSVQNYSMGTLVSGKVKFSGIITDGNGIDSLYYSINNGQTFEPIKISEKKGVWNFNITIDTTKFKDGPAVVWFKAIDKAGSEGIYSFLYFIDNTAPDVKIVYPEEKVEQFGKFVVTGFAKDAIGVKNLSWEFGSQKGEFELIPGNPYWGVEFDTSFDSDTSRKFVVTALDLAGNVITVSKKITLNQELNKPLVYISEPTSDTIIDSSGELFVRGIATDEDGVTAVKYSLDGKEFVTQETKGVFYEKITDGASLTPGSHRVTVVAIDSNGVEGNPVTVDFIAKGPVPAFSDIKVSGKDILVGGMSIHPEAGSSITGSVYSDTGISNLRYEILYGKKGIIENDLACNGSKSVPISIPITPDMPKGVVRVNIIATDTIGRSTDYKTILNIVNTSVVKSDVSKVVFEDSSVNADGVIINNPEFPVTGYFIGGTASRVEIVPKTTFATASLDGNKIILTSGSAIGSSDPVRVRVTTDQGLSYESRKLVFKNDTVIPTVTIKGAAKGFVDGSAGEVVISGSVSCATGIGSVGYRIFSAKVLMDERGVLKSVEPISKSEITPLKADTSFSIPFNALNYGAGVYFIEVIATSAGGNVAASAVCVRNIPALPVAAEGEKAIEAKVPTVVWADGENVYNFAVYQGEIETPFKDYKRSEMTVGSNTLNVEYSTVDGKLASSKYIAQKNPDLKANIAKVNGDEYRSGMNVVLDYNSKTAANVEIYIDTGATVNSVSYEITGDSVPGGDVKQTGSAKFVRQEEGSNRWVATIPLMNLPVRVTEIKATVRAGSLVKEVKGFVNVVRPLNKDITDDKKAIYIKEDSGSQYDEDSSSYIMKAGSKFNFYANVPAPIKADLMTAGDGLSVAVEGNNVVLTTAKDGTFTGISVRVKDANGIAYNSPAVNFIVDSGAPEVNISTPELHQWVKKSVRITGTATDPAGVKAGEYSVDGGKTWNKLALSVTQKGGVGATFSASVDITSFEDGVVPIDVRITDTAGRTSYARTVAYKDTTNPSVQVIVPCDEDVVNGDNLIVFKVTDNANFARTDYIAPPVAKQAQTRNPIKAGKFVMTHIGTTDQPIDDAMSFEFIDAAKNATSVEAWKFNIDRESDLPVAEIHLPTYDEVITRDFTISGVIYDDDGPCTIWYRIDKGEYQKLPDAGTSFAIDVPFSTMTDNEHSIFVYAVDINGVKGPVAERRFRVSTEEPKGTVELPTIDTSVKGIVTIKGMASDINGVAKVQISLDNGNSYNDAIGTTNWSYTFDSRAIPNGTQVVFLKIYDKYGIQGLYSSLINIDNEAPEMVLELPIDYSATAGPVFFSGNVFDNVNITDLYVTIRSFEGKQISRKMQRIDFEHDKIITRTIDISSLEDGVYNIELTALDKAGNATHVSRNIQLNKSKPLAVVNMLYPLNGEHKKGIFNIYGEIKADKKVETVSLYIDDVYIADTQLTASGYFKFAITPEIMTTGVHSYRVDTRVEGGSVIKSRTQTVDYSSVGPWVTIDNFTYGDFAMNRPYIKGHAGYSYDEDELLLSRTKGATQEQKNAIAQKKVEKIEISFDNGKTFTEVSEKEKWMHRVENQDLPEGYHFMIVKATMLNGETAIERTIIQIDNTNPTVRLISPSAGGRYNQEMEFSGLSNDNIGLKDVKLTLRKGDKASYEVPSFIQGLYLDWKFWGATLFDIGAGLTFFDDNVKLQFQWGQFTQAQRELFSMTQMRYGGDNVMGIKILANIASIPFSYMFGRDWEWLSATVAVGANFTRFNETGSGKPQILSALLAQVEFPKVTFPNMKMFSTFSLYTEVSLWFIPTDVQGGAVDINNMVPQISEGIRFNVF